MKELFPAEWFPSRTMEIFFRGASRFRPNPLAIVIRPLKKEKVRINLFLKYLQNPNSKRNLWGTCRRGKLNYCSHTVFVTRKKTIPLSSSVYKSWHSFKIRSFTLTEKESGAFAELRCFPDGIIAPNSARLSTWINNDSIVNFSISQGLWPIACWVNYIGNPLQWKLMFACSCLGMHMRNEEESGGRAWFPFKERENVKARVGQG